MLWNDRERSHSMSVASVCDTYEEEPNITLIVDEGFTIATLAKHPRLIWSARFTGATEIPSLVIADLASLQDRVPCQLTHIIETAGRHLSANGLTSSSIGHSQYFVENESP